MPYLRRFLLGAALVVCACRHSDAFQIADQSNDKPFVPAQPTRLTYNPLPDTEPSWLPGDSLLIYTAFRSDNDSDGCLELLPGGGGQAVRSICEPRIPGEDSTFSYEAGAVSPNGMIAYVRSAKGPPHPLWTEKVLMVRPLDGSAPPRRITTLPAIGLLPPHTSASQIAWLDDHRFVYRADLYLEKYRCSNCFPPYDDRQNLFVNLVDISVDPATITMVPGSDSATGVAVQDSDAILVGLAAGVNRIVLSTGASSVYYAGGAGEVQVAGNRLVLSSGSLLMVDVPGGAVTVIDPLGGWSNLALSSDGKRLVAQRNGDLWLFQLP